MQKSETSQVAKTAHRQMRASTTLNRKYVKRPERMTKAAARTTSDNDIAVQVKTNKTMPKISHFNRAAVQTMMAMKETEKITPVEQHPTQVIANQKLRERKEQMQMAQKQTTTKLTAKELKDQAIKKALATATKSTDAGAMAQTMVQEKQKKATKMRFGLGRVVLALTCAAAAVFAIVYFVSLNMPDVQFRATAAQLNATYPNYLPRNYNPTEIASESNIVTLSFENYNTRESFSITEEKSSWDSNSLLNNFVKDNYGENYTVVREQGLTIYIGDNKATWVNGGIVYKLTVKKGSLTKKQISSIAASF